MKTGVAKSCLRATLLSVLGSLLALAQDPAFVQWATNTAKAQVASRAAVMAQVQTTAAADARKQQVSALINALIGHLPDYSGPLNARVTGTVDRGQFHIEKVLFESLPGVNVSANLYVPAGKGPFPAVLVQIGHFQDGKAYEQLTCSNLALKGFVVLAFDPLGQAERLQGYNPVTMTSLAGWGTEQHFMAGAQAVLMEQTFARYEVFDAKRAIDYLVGRPEVDAARIGATGCSGGGTLTTYIAALDPRIQVAAPACYINSYSIALPAALGDSEQAWPNFLSSGLDEADLVEQFSPRPFLILSTQDDFFTPAGAQAVYDEAKSWYGLYGAADRINWVVGPGPHGTPVEIRQAIYGWMMQWLQGSAGDPTEQSVTLLPDSALQVTPNGYVGGLDVYKVISATPTTAGTRQALLNYASNLVQYTPQTSAAILGMAVDHGAYNATPLTYSPEAGITISAQLLTPKSMGTKPAAIYLESSQFESAAAVQLAQSGTLVLDIFPRGLPRTDAGGYIGEWEEAELAWLIGRNLPGMRAKDVLQGLDILLSAEPVDSSNVSMYANGVYGVTALLATALDTRITALNLNGTPYSFGPALNNPVHVDLHSAAMPGFSEHWDLSDLVSAIGIRKVSWTGAADWLGNQVSLQTTTPTISATFESKGEQGTQYAVDLTISNAGPGTALSVSLQNLTVQTIAGSGTVVPNITTPLSIGDVSPGSSVTEHILLNVPLGATRFSMSGAGALKSGIGADLTFSAAQTIFNVSSTGAGLGFYTVTPCRAVDTRTSQNKTAPFGPPALVASATRDFPLLSSGCGLPSTAQSYSLNFTVVPPARVDYLSVWPAGQSYPGVSTLNSSDGSILANAAIVPAGTNGSITVLSGNTTDLIVDANGYFAPPNGSELAFYPIAPCRVADTRTSQPFQGPFGPPSLVSGLERDFPIQSSACNIPATAAAYSLNMTAVPQGPLSYLSTWPAGDPYPNVSTLNSNDGSIIANATIVPGGTPNGSIRVLPGGNTDLIIDVNGYFAAPGAAGALHFYPVTPCRVADTRTSQPFSGPFGPPSLPANSNRDFPISSSACGIPATAQAYSLNLTVVPQGPLPYLSAWPAGPSYPNVSTLNSPKGTTLANAAIVPAGANGSITVLSGGATDLIIDINGYFEP